MEYYNIIIINVFILLFSYYKNTVSHNSPSLSNVQIIGK